MKYIIRILFVLFISFLGYGYYLKNSGLPQSEKFIGISVVILFFVLMPIFIFHRYRKKKLSDFEWKDVFEPKENTDNQ